MTDAHAETAASAQHVKPGKPTALQSVKANAAFLALGDKAATKPGSVATRSFLTTLR